MHGCALEESPPTGARLSASNGTGGASVATRARSRPWGVTGQARVASEVDHVASETVDGFLDGFTQGGVRVDVAGHLSRGELPLLGKGKFGQ